MIDKGRHGPPWRQLTDILREQITSGELAGNLPSEKTLSQEYGVAVNTVRKALAQLRAEGLIRTDRGWGSYVVEREPPGDVDGWVGHHDAWPRSGVPAARLAGFIPGLSGGAGSMTLRDARAQSSCTEFVRRGGERGRN